MNWQSFISLIQLQSENSFFLSNTRQERLIGKILCALLNTEGGKLIIGYDKVNVHLTGYEQTDQWIDQFIDDHFRNTVITSTFLFRSNKKVLILDVEKNQIDISYSGKFYHLNKKNIEEYTPKITQPAIHQPLYQENLQSQQSPNQIINTPIQSLQKPIITATHESNLKNEAVKPNISSSPTTPPITTQFELNSRQKKAVEFITKQGSIKNKQYRKLFSVSHKTAHIELAELVQKNKLIIVGSGRSTCYRLPNELQTKKIDSISISEAVIPKNLLDAFLAQHTQITESMYADEFNMDLAQAINELQYFCEEGYIEKSLIDNDIFYVKAKQLSFI